MLKKDIRLAKKVKKKCVQSGCCVTVCYDVDDFFFELARIAELMIELHEIHE